MDQILQRTPKMEMRNGKSGKMMKDGLISPFGPTVPTLLRTRQSRHPTRSAQGLGWEALVSFMQAENVFVSETLTLW